MSEDAAQGKLDAISLLSAGWRQATLFRPAASVEVAPVHGAFDRETEWLVVASQSCNVVSVNFTANPQVEVLVARPLQRVKERSREANGRNGRFFHMRVDGGEGMRGFECDLVRRAFLPRRALLACQPAGVAAPRAVARSFAGWIARNYGRAAFPNAFVERTKGLFEKILACLETEGPDGQPLDEGVQFTYVRVVPDDELEGGGVAHYTLYMRFLCHDAGTVEAPERLFGDALADYDGGAVVEGVALKYHAALTAQTFVADLKDYERLADWDYLSGMDEARATYASPLPHE